MTAFGPAAVPETAAAAVEPGTTVCGVGGGGAAAAAILEDGRKNGEILFEYKSPSLSTTFA